MLRDNYLFDFLLERAEREWSKPFNQRASYSPHLHLIFRDILRFNFDEDIENAIAAHPRFQSFMEKEFAKYDAEILAS